MNKLVTKYLQEDFRLDNFQIEQFVQYLSLLKIWNEKINLTGLNDEEEIIIKHFYDSLLCSKVIVDPDEKKFIDVGTGAGFPGIPLSIYYNHLEITLFDSLQKRLNFLDEVILKLGLKNIKTLHGRAEDMGKNNIYREAFDFVTARALARLPVLLELCLPLVKIGGKFIAMKGPEGKVELQECQEILKLLGGELGEVNEYSLKEIDHHRVIIVFNKTRPTPDKYPRKAGLPQKRPLK